MQLPRAAAAAGEPGAAALFRPSERLIVATTQPKRRWYISRARPSRHEVAPSMP